jgi:hypothetical protein
VSTKQDLCRACDGNQDRFCLADASAEDAEWHSATAIVDYRPRDSREIADPAASQKTVSGERIGALAA